MSPEHGVPSDREAGTPPSSKGDHRYGEAMAELEEILDELESESLDVDLLGARVKRASELIELCRGRILRAQSDVDAIVTDLEAFERELGPDGS